jgi:hypothetical protein
MSKLFTIAGTSVLEGVCKFRVANGSVMARVQVLLKNGHTDINLQDLPKPMSKEDAMAFLNYSEGKPVAAAKPAAAPKVRAEKTKAKDFKIPRAAPAAKPAKADADLEAVRAKNMETLRAVTAKNRALEQLQKQVQGELEQFEAEVEQMTRADIPQFLWKEYGLA